MGGEPGGEIRKFFSIAGGFRKLMCGIHEFSPLGIKGFGSAR
jgi:hypothetical protein